MPAGTTALDLVQGITECACRAVVPWSKDRFLCLELTEMVIHKVRILHGQYNSSHCRIHDHRSKKRSFEHGTMGFGPPFKWAHFLTSVLESKLVGKIFLVVNLSSARFLGPIHSGVRLVLKGNRTLLPFRGHLFCESPSFTVRAACLLSPKQFRAEVDFSTWKQRNTREERHEDRSPNRFSGPI